MTLNVRTHEAELRAAFDRLCLSTDHWCIFEYETNESNILCCGESGSDGFVSLLGNFHPQKIQYGFGTVTSQSAKQTKVFLILWQGELVSAIRLGQTATHLEELRDFARRINIILYARNEEDLNIETIQKKVNNLFGTMSPPPRPHKPFVPSPPVSSTYKKITEELELSEREKFWKEIRNEEEERQREELKRQEEQQKQWQLEKRLFEKELKEKNAAAKNNSITEPQAAPPPAPKPQKKSSLVSGRAQMFDEKIAELIRDNPQTPNRPKQFKFEVSLQPKNPPPPINSNNYNDNFIPIIEDPSKPVAKVVPQAITAEEPQIPQEPKKEIEIRAITLWDYTADDNTEISFDPNCVITEIEKLYDGWWRGKAPNGQIGLFPSNYVKLL